MFVRMIESMIHVYHHLRNGRHDYAQARLAHILAGLGQGLKDNGQMQKRADYIMCMPSPPVSLYHVHSAEERQALKDKPHLGAVTRFAGPTRGAAARSLFFENSGA